MRRRILLAILLSVVIVLGTLGVVSYHSVNDSIRRSLDDRLRLAGIVAGTTDRLLQDNMTRLYDISLSGAVDIDDGDWTAERHALHTAYAYSLFSDGLYLLDDDGNILLSYPPGRRRLNLGAIPQVKETLRRGRACVTDLCVAMPERKKLIYVFVPVKDRFGQTVGAVGGEIDPTSQALRKVMSVMSPATETFLELVDSRGTVIASNKPERAFRNTDHNRFLAGLIRDGRPTVTTCHRCHKPRVGSETIESRGSVPDTDILAFAPLAEAAWGVTIREPRALVFQASAELKRRFLLLGLIAVGSSAVLAWGLSRGIVRPVQRLTRAAERMAAGRLEDAVATAGPNEIGRLAEGFEFMRARLAESLATIRRTNVELEHRVDKRTRALQHHRKRLAMLLQEVMDARENERRRIARELHDETSQALTALGLALDMAGTRLRDGTLQPEDIATIRKRLADIMDGLRVLIRDLRPPVLDDLGLEAAVEWLARKHLGDRGIAYDIIVTDGFRKMVSERLRSSVDDRRAELALFRVIQEAVVNIERHARAHTVTILLQTTEHGVQVFVEDDGACFDVAAVMAEIESGRRSGFGILGMKERLALMDGSFDIRSAPGEGTVITAEIPVSALRAENV